MGDFHREEIELENIMTGESRTFKIEDEDDYSQAMDTYFELRESDGESAEFWTKIHSKYTYCQCGEEVECSGFTNTCDCGRDYSFDGSLLADRSQWGEETGEHWSEII